MPTLESRGGVFGTAALMSLGLAQTERSLLTSAGAAGDREVPKMQVGAALLTTASSLADERPRNGISQTQGKNVGNFKSR